MGDVGMSIAIQNIVLSFDSVNGVVAIRKENFQQNFHMVIFVFHFFLRTYSILMTRHYLDLGSGASSVWNSFARFSDVISPENQRSRRKCRLFSQANLVDFFL